MPNKIISLEYMESFNWVQYLSNYPDLKKARIRTEAQALNHYQRYGILEGRTDRSLTQPVKITIITPCTRPCNLQRIFESINFDYIEEWIIVYDFNVLNPSKLENRFNHSKISEYYVGNQQSVSGNYQRNYGLSKISNPESYIYFLDDDNLVHPGLYSIPLTPGNFYTFDQLRDSKTFEGNTPRPQKIDSAMVLIYYPMVKGITWNLGEYHADGIYIRDCYLKCINRWIYINKILCYYNKLNESV
jgi:hypothetical protein